MGENNVNRHTTFEWESAAYAVGTIELIEIHIHKGYVCGASGVIAGNRQAKWLYDGKCYCKGKRMPEYDIIFNI